jgi:hypothetical protein
MQADILSLRRATESHRERERGRTSRRRRAPQPVNFNQLGLTVPLVQPQAPQPLQPVPQPSIDLWPLLSELTGLVGEAYSKDWRKKSPVSQLIFRISQRAMESPHLSEDGKKFLELFSAGTLLYGLKQDN